MTITIQWFPDFFFQLGFLLAIFYSSMLVIRSYTLYRAMVFKDLFVKILQLSWLVSVPPEGAMAHSMGTTFIAMYYPELEGGIRV